MFTGTRLEKVALILLSLTFLIGIWHGFPFTNVVADEGFFSGAVLRSMQSHSLFPLQLDVPYGTLTFYLSYVFIAIGLVLTWMFTGLNLSALQLFIIKHPFVAYGFSRLVSVTLGILILFGFNHVLKKYVADYRTRLVIIITLFTNILVNIIFHTSKVWVLSTVLLLLSFYFLVKVFEDIDGVQNKKYILYSIILSFLSFANFPIMGMALVSIPLLLYVYRKKHDYRNIILKASLIGFGIFFLVLVSNFSGIQSQVSSILFEYTLSPVALAHNASIGLSAYLHLKKVLILFPPLVLLLIYTFFYGKVKHRKLFWLSTLYLCIYITLLIFVDRWSLVDKAAVRYLFPVPFFLALIVSSFDGSFRKTLLVPSVVSVVYLLPTLYFLSVPTTSHQAINFIKSNFSFSPNIVFFNHVGADTPIPQNKTSYELFKKGDCGSLCVATKELNLQSDFKPIVVDSHTDPDKIATVIKGKSGYYVLREAGHDPTLSLVASFVGPVTDVNYYSADNTGNYFDFAYFQLERFGPNIYIYKDLKNI